MRWCCQNSGEVFICMNWIQRGCLSKKGQTAPTLSMHSSGERYDLCAPRAIEAGWHHCQCIRPWYSEHEDAQGRLGQLWYRCSKVRREMNNVIGFVHIFLYTRSFLVAGLGYEDRE